MTPSAQIAGGRRIRRWSRETIIEKIREWEDRYGEPPCSADWNPSLARWRAQEWRVERYRDGFWPSTNAAKRPFGGSFDAALRAAGFEPHRPGPRRRAAGVARPDFAQRAQQEPRAIGDEPADAEARAAALERRLRAAERRAGRAEHAARDALARARRASEREGRARRARETSERVEDLVADGDAHVRAALASGDHRSRAPAAGSGALSSGQARANGNGALSDDDSGRARATGNGSAASWEATRDAEERAAAAERRARELAVLVCGQARRLSRAELEALRAGGPSGPAVLAAALKRLARARAGGSGPALDAALTELASAAIRWRDRL